MSATTEPLEGNASDGVVEQLTRDVMVPLTCLEARCRASPGSTPEWVGGEDQERR